MRLPAPPASDEESSSSDTFAPDARQRRVQRRKRSRSDDNEDEEYSEGVPLSSIKGIKKQARYEPVVPMSKAELSKWRKEARRVRNRESAAASRRKTRERIQELEEQVEALTSQHQAALNRIAELEQEQGDKPSSTQLSATHRHVSPPLSPKTSDKNQVAALTGWSLPQQEVAASLAQSLDALPSSTHHQSHPPLTISRPTAV